MACELNRDQLFELAAIVHLQVYMLQRVDNDQFNRMMEFVNEHTGGIPHSSKAAALAEEQLLLDKLLYMARNAP